MPDSAYLELLDWRRRVADLFAAVRHKPPDARTLDWFRSEKDALFGKHPQSPLPAPERATFTGLAYWPYDARARVTATFRADEPEAEVESGGGAETSSGGAVPFRRVGQLEFDFHGQPLTLAAFWIEGYGGGLFVPFTDATSGRQTYGGGRYLLDTIKSADLGSDAGSDTVVLDFNYAYHPSCVYDRGWVCPLAPRDSRLAIPIEAGEKLP